MKSTQYKISIKNNLNTKDYSSLAKLINSSYEQNESWTDKNLEVVARQRKRTDEEEVKQILNDKTQKFLILSDSNTEEYLASLVIEAANEFHITKELDTVNHFTFGLFAVLPEYQSNGIGKHLLKFAEAYMKFSVESAKNLETKEQIQINERLQKEYNCDFDVLKDIENSFEKSFLKEVEGIYINCIVDKKELYAFYRKVGYVDLNTKTLLTDFMKDEDVIVKSHWTYMKKSISEVVYS